MMQPLPNGASARDHLAALQRYCLARIYPIHWSVTSFLQVAALDVCLSVSCACLDVPNTFEYAKPEVWNW